MTTQSSNQPQKLTTDRIDRSKMKSQIPVTIWLTGLSGAGKSTLANALEIALIAQGHHTFVLDGDNLRSGLCRDLGFSDKDRQENIRRATEVAKLLLDAGLIVITAFISPFTTDRQTAREAIGSEHFIEVYVDTALDICERRDPKGLYRAARSGAIKDFTGIHSPYEPPEHPDIRIDTSLVAPESAVELVLMHLAARQSKILS
ncbi:adenylyl-sulfate kinase [Pseudomonas bohemica]|uniref:adenylyl-sulfate kinase n=1 Tax=Pseudomonas bohemica TaxID=2044872 RepID=UPI000DA6225A|nr:adenylyl-sulfate kinase [Pseudomonas bohemica]